MNIDLGNIESIEQLHLKLKDGLEFPEFYGKNWDAFWDAITGIITLSEPLEFDNWISFEKRFPRDSRILKELAEEYNSESHPHSINIKAGNSS